MAIQVIDIISFWYSKEMRPYWFKSTKSIDLKIRDQYYDVWQQAGAGKLDDWLHSAEGCLALAIILDQFPLNMFRGEAGGFSTEAQAIAVAKYAIENNFDTRLESEQRVFLYMPLMHSENMDDQNLAVSMFEKAGLEANLRFARHHRDIVQRFGRFPHRNAILGRTSSPQELDYLASASSFKG